MELALEPEPEPERQPDSGPAGQPRRVSWQWEPGAEPEHGAWEWRYFAPSPLPADASELRGCREDVYFPASSTAGLKLRRGKGKLEVKLCHETCAIAGRGQAECWSKQLSGGCTSARGGIDPQACAVALCCRCVVASCVVVRCRRALSSGDSRTRERVRWRVR